MLSSRETISLVQQAEIKMIVCVYVVCSVNPRTKKVYAHVKR